MCCQGTWALKQKHILWRLLEVLHFAGSPSAGPFLKQQLNTMVYKDSNSQLLKQQKLRKTKNILRKYHLYGTGSMLRNVTWMNEIIQSAGKILNPFLLLVQLVDHLNTSQVKKSPPPTPLFYISTVARLPVLSLLLLPSPTYLSILQ